MSTNYSPTIVTDGAVFVGDARMPSISEPGTRLYNRAGVDSAAVKLLIHGNVGSGQSFSDSSLSNHTVTANGDVTHSSTQSKFSGGSIYFDGSDSLSVPDSADWNIGSGDFTMDAWVYFSGTSNVTLHNQSTGGAASDSAFIIWVSGTIGIYLSDGTGWDYSNVNSATLSSNQWYHMAAVRYGDSLKMYVNGVSTSSTSLSSGWTVGDSSRVLQIGEQDGGSYLNGYLDEVRFIKGAALWTQNFTPPARRDTLSISDGMMYNGGCLNFDGSDDWVDCGSSPITSNSAFSWAAWINPTGSSGTPFFLGTTVAGEAMVAYWDSSTGIVRLGVWGADRLYSTIAIPVNSWGHTCWTWDGTTLRAYTNGVAAGTATPAAFNIASNDMIIGAASASAQEFEGNIADVKLFNVALSASQVKELYQDSKVIIPSNISQTNLKGWWPLVDGAGDYAYDGSGNGNDGTLTNMASDDWLTGQTGCPQLVEGYNRPMLFDGSNDYVNITDGLTSGTNAVSISVWCNGISGNSYYPAWRLGNAITAGLCIHGTLNRIEGGAGASETFDKTGFGNSLVDGTWHHILVTYDGSEIRKYEDGVYISGATFSSHGTWTAADGLGSETNTTIGSFWAGYFEGMINELIVYDTTLVAADAAILAATGPNGGPLPPDPYGMSYSAGISSSNIAGYWRNDGDVTWTDRSGNGNTGTVNGSPDALLFKQGINGSASTSTGRDNQGFPLFHKNVGAIGFEPHSHVDVGSLGTSGEFSSCTISVWMRKGVQIDNYGNVYDCNYGATTYNKGPRMEVDIAGSVVRVYMSSDAGNYVSISFGGLSNDVWYNLVLTVTPNGTGQNLKTYTNGALITTSTSSSTYLWDGDIADLYLGVGYTAGRHFTGDIANCQIYDRTLSRAEILQNYNAQKSRFI